MNAWRRPQQWPFLPRSAGWLAALTGLVWPDTRAELDDADDFQARLCAA